MMLEPLVLTSAETWRWRRLKNLIPGRRRWNTKRSRHRHLLDDVPASFKKAKTVHMAARRKSEKGKAKQLEKELPWGTRCRPPFRNTAASSLPIKGGSADPLAALAEVSTLAVEALEAVPVADHHRRQRCPQAAS